jgi:hypothetical protein
MFKLKQKPVIINCYTSRLDVYKNTPIALSKKHIPPWFKALKPRSSVQPQLDGAPLNLLNTANRLSIKSCPAMIGYHMKGFTLPMWSELVLRWDGVGSNGWEYIYADQESELTPHSADQWENCSELSGYQHFKLISPWIVEVEEDVEFLVKDSLWGFLDLKNLHIMSGVVKFDNQNHTHVNIFARKTEKQNTLLIPYNMPMMDYIPLTDRPIELKLHLITEQEFAIRSQPRYKGFFFSQYRKAKKIFDQVTNS